MRSMNLEPGVLGFIDDCLCRSVKAEAGKNKMVIAATVGLPNRLLNLHCGDWPVLRAEYYSDIGPGFGVFVRVTV